MLELRPPDSELQYLALPAQGSLAIGREAPADLVLPDTFLSRVHFQIQFQDGVFAMTDTGSTNGTYVNGVRLTQSLLTHGDMIYAGRTAIRLSRQHRGKAELPLPPTAPKLAPGPQEALQRLLTKGNFMLLDSAIDAAVQGLLNGTGVFYQSLYEGDGAAEIAPYGPFLVDLSRAPQLIPFLVTLAWGKSWAIFMKAEVTFEELRKHLRLFLTIESEGSKRMLFRFYDPRVLRIFLPTCDSEQTQQFFGPVQWFLAESEEPEIALVITPAGQQPVTLGGAAAQ